MNDPEMPVSVKVRLNRAFATRPAHECRSYSSVRYVGYPRELQAIDFSGPVVSVLDGDAPSKSCTTTALNASALVGRLS
jgi:hypothetical protein